jgi:hypothetical protein
MDVNDASHNIERKSVKVAKEGTPKKYPVRIFKIISFEKKP